MPIKALIALMRPHQYVKNLFLFLPLFFGLQITNLELLIQVFWAFVAFSLGASAIYILNDYRDIEDDRQHPKKCTRPLASGAVKPQQGFALMIGLVVIAIVIMGSLSLEALWVLLLYLVLNIAYSFKLKHIALLDVTTIAIGFVLRLFIGALASGMALSMWIVVMTFLLALFLALAKRRDDVLTFMETGQKMRKVIDGYNLQLLDIAMAIMASVVIMAYILYTTSAEVIARLHSEYLYLTAFFVILGVLRYLQIAFVYQDSGSPTKVVLQDRFVQLNLLGWILTFVWILY
ncbi:UbiA prenyltransferase family protein [Thiomicrorhabdus xiamenensis]|uniref:UbiA prenyltransferase family protein n=1 Tax=Thiomicrorhabdus xiamenensis TaxID=2739063 RepID=A0A7D4NS92_9GAMM|nr:UbiA prenyltransferase family protein [Thiomicrorhabdus xiamenensis]QKI89757.1 UbiA prenyltransferase family protein [Thiomicrorhabdus xiamenensis]